MLFRSLDILPEIEAALEAHIAEASAAIGGKWAAWSNTPNGEAMPSRIAAPSHRNLATVAVGNHVSAAFIAKARTMSPFACKSLLPLIKWLQKIAIPVDAANKQLEQICRNWIEAQQ